MTGKIKGRPLQHPPKLTFEVRRYLTLVQVLALDKRERLKLTDLQALARAWQLPDDGDFQTLLTRLSQHVVEYHAPTP